MSRIIIFSIRKLIKDPVKHPRWRIFHEISQQLKASRYDCLAEWFTDLNALGF